MTSQRQRTPLFLRIELAFELDNAGYVIGPLIKSIGRPFWKCAHGKRSIGFVILTEESSREMVARLGLADITAIEDYSVSVAPIGAICKHGSINTLHSALDQAWKAVGERRHTAYREQRERFDPRRHARVSDKEFGAVREARR